jgi:hypothetical protein
MHIHICLHCENTDLSEARYNLSVLFETLEIDSTA